MTSKISRNLPHPLPVSTDLVTTKRFEVELTAPTATFTISAHSLITTIPGGVTVWDRVQFKRFDVWGGSPTYSSTGGTMSPVTVSLLPLPGSSSNDQPTGYADPVGTSRRAHVGITPNSLYQNQWINSATVDPLLTITSSSPSASATQGACILQFVAVLRSSGTTAGDATEAAVRRVDAHDRQLTALPETVFTVVNGQIVQTKPVHTTGILSDATATAA